MALDREDPTLLNPRRYSCINPTTFTTFLVQFKRDRRWNIYAGYHISYRTLHITDRRSFYFCSLYSRRVEQGWLEIRTGGRAFMSNGFISSNGRHCYLTRLSNERYYCMTHVRSTSHLSRWKISNRAARVYRAPVDISSVQFLFLNCLFPEFSCFIL